MAFDDFDDFDQPLRGEGGGGRFPTVKFNEVGDRFVGMVIDYDDKAPLYVYGTQERKVTPQGKEQTKDVLTVLLMKGTTAPVTDPAGEDGALLDDAEGVVARVHIQGHNRWTPDRRPEGQKPAWRNALDEYAEFRRGCVVMGQFEATSRVGANGAKLSQDKKIVGFAVRAAKADEQALIDRCKKEYRDIKAAKAAATEQPSGTPAYVRTAAPVPADDAF